MGGSAKTSLVGNECNLVASSNLLPEVMRIEIERLMDMTHRKAKPDGVVLYDLTVRRAVRQQHYHLMQVETK
ncbi:LOW QUALITY PROTEIN: Hypothetical protein PHPALM_19609 [Phytophthora palmivora]|uniref:Uncharacterized protein n=1 Tax=Phytophthora palmivora TaxID=4796 RepID=A0A2P4XGZ4_9STRA|nr:LOW QUALITY PROTEIN: Hypothetical protein PHPALM_19609 [Phytophthora palmivora]